MIFNLPEYRILTAAVTPLGRRRITVESDRVVPGCPRCSVVSSRVEDRRLQRLRGIPVAGPAMVL